MDGQAPSGGWVYRYAPANDGDNSVGYWQIQALKACKHTGLLPESKFSKVSRKALEWLDKAQGGNGAIGYHGNSNAKPRPDRRRRARLPDVGQGQVVQCQEGHQLHHRTHLVQMGRTRPPTSTTTTTTPRP